MMQRQETLITFEQATIRAESYVGHEEKLRCLLQSRRIDENKFHSPCRFPGCKCRDYQPTKKT
jgi:hypothetical protein